MSYAFVQFYLIGVYLLNTVFSFLAKSVSLTIVSR